MSAAGCSVRTDDHADDTAFRISGKAEPLRYEQGT